MMAKNRRASFGPDYHVYVLDGLQPLYDWKRWRQVSAVLDPFVAAARGSAGVTSIQFPQRKRVQTPIGQNVEEGGGRRIAFGSMKWDEAKKWTHSSPTSGAASRKWFFVETEVYAPSRRICTIQATQPDFYLHLVETQPYLPGTETIYAVLAFSTGLPRKLLRTTRDAVQNIGTIGEAKRLAFRQRPWGWTDGDGALIEDALELVVGWTVFSHVEWKELALR